MYRSGSRNYRRPNIGRLYRSTDASNIPFRGEASSDLAISGERGTQVYYTLERTEPSSRSLQEQLRARQESLPVYTEGRTRPWPEPLLRPPTGSGPDESSISRQCAPRRGAIDTRCACSLKSGPVQPDRPCIIIYGRCTYRNVVRNSKYVTTKF